MLSVYSNIKTTSSVSTRWTVLSKISQANPGAVTLDAGCDGLRRRQAVRDSVGSVFAGDEKSGTARGTPEALAKSGLEDKVSSIDNYEG